MPPLTKPRWNPRGRPPLGQRDRFAGAQFGRVPSFAPCAGRTIVRVLPSERLLANQPEGTPLPDSKAELPPVIRRTEVVAFALVALLIIVHRRGALCRKSVLPADHDGVHRRHHVVAGGWLCSSGSNSARGWRGADRDRGCAAVAFMIGLIASPVMEWSSRLAGARRDTEGQTARIRPPAGALAGIADACSAARQH